MGAEAGRVGGTGVRRRRAAIDCRYMRFMRNAMKLRCVATAPFGFPVVPDVYMIVASSSGSTVMSGNVPMSRSSERVGERLRVRHVALGSGEHDVAHCGRLARSGASTLGALLVGEQRDAARVGQPERELGTGPPRVERDSDAPDGDRSPRTRAPTRDSSASRSRRGLPAARRTCRAVGRARSRCGAPRRTSSARPRTRGTACRRVPRSRATPRGATVARS